MLLGKINLRRFRLPAHVSYKRDLIIKLPAPFPLPHHPNEEIFLAGRDTKGIYTIAGIHNNIITCIRNNILQLKQDPSCPCLYFLLILPGWQPGKYFMCQRCKDEFNIGLQAWKNWVETISSYRLDGNIIPHRFQTTLLRIHPLCESLSFQL